MEPDRRGGGATGGLLYSAVCDKSHQRGDGGAIIFTAERRRETQLSDTHFINNMFPSLIGPWDQSRDPETRAGTPPYKGTKADYTLQTLLWHL